MTMASSVEGLSQAERLAVVESRVMNHKVALDKFEVTCNNLSNHIGEIKTNQAVMSKSIEGLTKAIVDQKKDITESSKRSIRNIGVALAVINIVVIVLMKLIP